MQTYDRPTPETDAFMLLIDDSEIDLRQVESKLQNLECQRDYARELLKRGVDKFGWMDGPDTWPEFIKEIAAVLKDNTQMELRGATADADESQPSE